METSQRELIRRAAKHKHSKQKTTDKEYTKKGEKRKRGLALEVLQLSANITEKDNRKRI